MKGKLLKVLTILGCLTLGAGLVACGGKDEHTHDNKTAYNDKMHWQECKDSDCKLQSDFESHSFEWVTDQDATISETGLKHEECSCGYIRNENTVIEKLPHDCQWGLEYEYDATHHWFECIVENCGEQNKTAHNFEWKESQLPTCTQVGWDTYQACTDCAYNTKVELPANHSLYTVDAQDATCTQAGWEAYQACYNCDYNTKVEIPAGHDLYDVEAREPNCTQVGWDAYQACRNCDYNTKVELPAKHDIVEHLAQIASCTQVGWNAYETCKICSYTTYEEIPMEDHDYQDKACSVCGAKQPSEGLKFDYVYLNCPAYEVSLGTCTDTEVVIPSEYEGKPVAKIKARGFDDSAITSITIPATVIQMGGYGGAFNNCTSLREVNFLGTIEQWAQINFGEYFTNNPLWLAGNLYIKGELVKDAALSVSYVEDLAFIGCKSLETVTLLAGVEKVGQNVFANCSSLKKVTIAPTVKEFDSNAFENTESIERVNYLGTIDEWVQTRFYLATSNPLYLSDAELYVGDVLADEITISSETINKFVFYNYNALKSVTLATSVKSIKISAFYSCDALTAVSYAGTTEEWGSGMELDYRWVYEAPVTSITCSNGSVNIPDYS